MSNLLIPALIVALKIQMQTTLSSWAALINLTLFRVLSELNMKSKSNLFTFFTHVQGHIVHDTIVKKKNRHALI